MCMNVELKKTVDKWNREYSVGTDVNFKISEDETKITRTESEAELAGGTFAVIKLAGFEGWQQLQRVNAA
ncbi:MAG: hypothetical protein K9L30_15590 [Desulfobacterales bacterium]|nr:hypothetical protein [Desulfobacterales bacterium]